MSDPSITYWFYDLVSAKLEAQLPVTGPTWSKRLNSVGQYSAKLPLADPRVRKHTWTAATRPARSLVVVTVGGAIEWAGILWDRTYESATRTLSLSAGEAWSYFSRRVQTRDYTNPPATGPGHTYWTANPARADHIAAALVADAIASSGSAFSSLTIDIVETQTDTSTVTEQLPISQRQTIGNVVTQLAGAGIGTGFDFAVTWAWSGAPGSTPVPTLTFSFPRSGRIAGATGLVVDFGTAAKEGYTWPEAGSQQANALYGTAGGSSTLTASVADANVLTAGWPRLEAVVSYIGINTQSALNAALNGDLARMEWPVLTPTVTVPMFGKALMLGDFTMGDTVAVVIPPDERFPEGLTTYLRIVGLDCTPGDQGLPVMKLSFATAPALAPVAPPPGL